MPTTRPAIAGLAALGSLAVLLALPAPARASCAQRDVDADLAAGRTVAVVTRTDKGGSHATFRVEAYAGPKPPATLTGRVAPAGDHQPFVPPGTVAALIFYRDGDAWVLPGCSTVELGPALRRAQGVPVAVEGGPIVAYGAGNFGGARVVGVDAQGRTVAWGGGDGYGDRVAACPGGSTVVVLGRSPARANSARSAELTAHDAATLRVRRTVDVPFDGSGYARALRCRDADARQVDVLADLHLGPEGRESEERGRLLTVTGTRVTHRDLEPVTAAAAVPDGFVAVLGAVGAKETTLVRVGPHSTRTIARLPDPTFSITGHDDALAVSPDGRTVALQVHRPSPAPNGVVTVDLQTGRTLGSWKPDGRYVTGLGWLGPKRLLVRDGADRDKLPLRLIDRQARPRGAWASVVGDLGGRVGAVGGDAVVYGGGSRLTAVPRSGPALVAESLRLAAAVDITGVPGAQFAAGGRAPEAADPPEGADGRRTTGLLVAALGGLTVLPLLAFARHRRRA